MFPGCKRAPIKDVWHGIETVAKTTAGSSHLLYDSFKRELWNAILKWTKPSVNAALECYVKKHANGRMARSKEVACEELFKSKFWRKRMINFIPADREESMTADIIQIYLKTRELDKDYANQARGEGKSYQYLFKQSAHNTNTLGTKEAIDHLVSHIRKGCFSDPLPPNEMSYPTTKDRPKDNGPFIYNRKHGTNVVEAGNKHGRIATVADASRQRSELSHRRFLVYSSQHNLMSDAKIAHLTGKKARPRDWFVREALNRDLQKLTRTSIDDKAYYPPEIDLSKHQEPIGELYQQAV